ncbi:hypothetical protein [Streptomyces venezuelae]|nr:hypothetical protein [Streptomyces venezuelae]
MADFTTETVTRTIRRWIIPAAEPWGAAAEEIVIEFQTEAHAN